MTKLRGKLAGGGASLTAIALLLVPALTFTGMAQSQPRAGALTQARPVGAFTPAVADPRLAAFLARNGNAPNGGFRFTPASNNAERNRAVRVAIRARASTPQQAARETLAAAPAITPITPISYNLGASLGWRRFAVSGDIGQSEGGIVPGRRDSAEVGMSYRATRRLTGRVSVAAERTEGTQRLIAEDESYSLDVGGAFSIARNVDVTAGARYRVTRDGLDSIARDERRDSQAVYIGTAFRF